MNMKIPSSEQLDRRLQRLISETANNVQQAQAKEAPKQGKEKRTSQADRILELVKSQNITLFRDEFSEPFVRFSINNHLEIWSLRSKKFKTWLSRQLWEIEHKTYTTNAIDSALGVLAGKASFEGNPIILSNRAAEDREGYWYDLANETWQAIHISSIEWRVVDRTPILFRRYNHQLPQVQPIHGGNIKKLLNFVNLKNPSEELLLLIYVVTCFVPDIPHPIAAFYGPQGAAKTTLGRMLRSIIDPSSLSTLSMPTSGNELIQQLYHHWFPFFDNITYISDTISDDLCRAVTGGGFSKRELYSNDDDVIYNFRRPIGLNGINLVAKRPDLLDRSILFQLDRIPNDKRRQEKKLWSEFELSKPIILGGIFDALSTAMCLYPSISVSQVPRMADFTIWGCAIAQALGYTQEEFLEAYFENISTQQDHAIQENPVAYAMVQFMNDQDCWEGSMSDLLGELNNIATDERLDAYRSGWPNAANALSHKLNEVRANLMDRGIFITHLRSRGVRKLKIEKAPKKIDPIVQSTPDGTMKAIFGADVLDDDQLGSTLQSATLQAPLDDRADGDDVSLPF